MWKGKSQLGKFSSKGLSLTTHMSWAEAGEWPLNSWKSLQAAAQALGQELCWRMIRIFPKHPCKPPQGLTSSQHQGTSNGASLEQSRAEQRCQICFVCHRWFKARGFSCFPVCKQSAPKPLSCWPHFCLASISTAVWRTLPDPSVLLFPLLAVQSYLHLFVLLFRGLPAQCCKHYLSSKHHLSSQEMSFQMRKEAWTGWDYPRLEAGGFWLMFLVAAFCDPTV